MSDINIEEVKEQELPEIEIDKPIEETKKLDKTEENDIPSVQQQEEQQIKKKYSKDHERAYFDSADWALGKQGAKGPKGSLEALRPKLQIYYVLEKPISNVQFRYLDSFTGTRLSHKKRSCESFYARARKQRISYSIFG